MTEPTLTDRQHQILRIVCRSGGITKSCITHRCYPTRPHAAERDEALQSLEHLGLIYCQLQRGKLLGLSRRTPRLREMYFPTEAGETVVAEGANLGAP